MQRSFKFYYGFDFRYADFVCGYQNLVDLANLHADMQNEEEHHPPSSYTLIRSLRVIEDTLRAATVAHDLQEEMRPVLLRADDVLADLAGGYYGTLPTRVRPRYAKHPATL